ncbi:unnamed protein product [Discosporangium mesarthrocarpum]
MVLLYFSAAWCPPCQKFSPVLAHWAKERSDDVVVVFVSFDRSEPLMAEFARGKGFVYIPFHPGSTRAKVADAYNIKTLPTVVVVNGDTGETVTRWGREAVWKNPVHCLERWREGQHGVTWWQLLRPW